MGASNNDREELRKIFIPLTAAEVIWDYVDKTLAYCAENRIDETKKLSRAVRTLHASYDDYVSRFLDRRHVEVVELACAQFKQQFSYDLTVMLCSIANELNYKYAKQHRQIVHEPMRVTALCSIMLLRSLRCLPDMAIPQKLQSLDAIMEAYAAPYELDLTRNIELCQRGLTKCLAEVAEMEINV